MGCRQTWLEVLLVNKAMELKQMWSEFTLIVLIDMLQRSE